MVAVRFSISAWLTYRSLPDNDPLRAGIERIAFDLVERGTAPPDAHPADWPWGTGTTPGFSVDLAHAGGSIACAPLADPRTGERFIGVIHIFLEE